MIMIEKVANVLKNFKSNKDGPLTDETWKEVAKAAIEAMKAPTEEMIIAGIHCGEGYGTQPETWQAMIDAALEGK